MNKLSWLDNNTKRSNASLEQFIRQGQECAQNLCMHAWSNCTVSGCKDEHQSTCACVAVGSQPSHPQHPNRTKNFGAGFGWACSGPQDPPFSVCSAPSQAVTGPHHGRQTLTAARRPAYLEVEVVSKRSLPVWFLCGFSRVLASPPGG